MRIEYGDSKVERYVVRGGAGEQGAEWQLPDVSGDVDPPDLTKAVIVFCAWLVVERSDAHNWTLMERRLVESGKNAGRHAWKVQGFNATPGQAARKALQMMTERKMGHGIHSLAEWTRELSRLEERVKDQVEPLAREDARRQALQDALAVVKHDDDKKRIQKLLDAK